MSEDVILAAIRLDTLSTTATAVYNENPDNFYPSAAGVPRHTYTCLAALLTGMGTLTDLTSISRGTGANPTVGIIIEPSRSYEGNDFDDIMNNPEPGATRALVKIIVKGIRTGTDLALVRDIGLRLQYILDHNHRAIEGNTYMANRTNQEIDTSADITILNPLANNSGYFRMFLQRSDELSVGEWSHVYKLEFIRNFG